MITAKLLGGLGNQLFQIFTVISYGLKNNQIPRFLYSTHTAGMSTRTTYWDSILSNLNYMLVEKLPEVKYIKERSFTYADLDSIGQNGSYLLQGYFQSYKYFDKYHSSICRLLKLENQKQMVRNNTRYELDNSISIHFRIGDYKDIQDKHPILPLTYYANALQYILDNTKHQKLNVLYFCEEKDKHEVYKIVDVLKSMFTNVVFQHVTELTEDWQQMLVMSCCSHNIIANSTFSWWGAYFNINNGHIVCYPNKWFGPALAHDTKDLFPKNWIQIPID